MNFLDAIRLPKKQNSIGRQIIVTLLTLLLGISLGIFSKYLDHTPGNLFPFLMKLNDALDFGNFLGGFAPWIIIALCIAVYNKTPAWAAINVFVFFVGMVGSYYWYSKYIAGFFPRSYAMIWVGFTFLSPLLAVMCWYAKGCGWISCLLSAGVLGVLFNTAFVYGMVYVSMTSWLNVLMFGIALFILRRKREEMFTMVVLVPFFAIAINILLPFHIW